MAEATLVALLRERARLHPERLAFTYLLNGESEDSHLTFASVDLKARTVAALLQANVDPGQRALLLYPPGLTFLPAFLGCLYSGILAVPVYPPRNVRHMQRLEAIARDAQADILLTTLPFLSKIRSWVDQSGMLETIALVATDGLDDALADKWTDPGIQPADLAFLQYTSGSTSTPRGVVVSHANLMHNAGCVQRAFHLSEETRSVSWMPHFHDMGLIEGQLQPLFCGYPAYLMAPTAFIQQPCRWLKAISHYHATHSSGPNFAFDLCTRKVSAQQRAELDLSCWKTVLNGAEPIRAETVERFAETFEPCGFDPTAHRPGYGLAEATLLVASTGTMVPPIIRVNAAALEQDDIVPAAVDGGGNRRLVGCGTAVNGTRIRIVDPVRKTECPPNRVGEIWLMGPSKARGYWRDPGNSTQVFEARLADTSEGPFLRTGDLGFLRADGQLFVTGRLKDLIIVAGANHYPQDIELTVEKSHQALMPGAGAAVALEVNGEEQLSIVQEVKRSQRRDVDPAEIFAAVSAAVAGEHDLPVQRLVLLQPGTIPKTSSGKIRRGACRQGIEAGSLSMIGQWSRGEALAARDAGAQPASDRIIAHDRRGTLREWLRARIAQRVGIAPVTLDTQRPFAELGLVSRDLVGLAGELEIHLGAGLSPTLLYERPTIEELVDHLCGVPSTSTSTEAVASSGVRLAETDPIAVIGLGCRFPGASDPEAFWQLLVGEVDAIREVPDQRWRPTERGRDNPPRHFRIGPRWGGFIDHAGEFDAAFFRISPREAEAMDPQQRLLLEVAWEALEDAGQTLGNLGGSRTAVFVGISTEDYARLQAELGVRPDAYRGTGTAFSIAANRLSYFLDLRGPSIAVDTACSSSLVAVHQACRSLQAGESEMALAGGVNLILSPELGIGFSEAHMLAEDGRCKTFDAQADGYVRAEGCGIVVLKPLSRAIADGDPVLALIRGSAVNQDGRSNGLTAPNGLAQRAVIRAALEQAGVEPEDIDLVEMHGTGTPLGDPVEVEALSAVLGASRPRGDKLWIGSVKTNIGHLEAAAGIAGLVKAILALGHRSAPAHLHLKEPNPLVPWDELSVRVPVRRELLQRKERPLRAGVSSFGFGGTNAHVIIEEAVRASSSRKEIAPGPYLFPVSAADEQALKARIRDLHDWLEKRPHEQGFLQDLSYTLGRRRSHLNCRSCFVAEDAQQLEMQLAQALRNPPAHVSRLAADTNAPSIAMVFTGQGNQWPGMGGELMRRAGVFRQTMERLDQRIYEEAGWRVLDVLAADEPSSELHRTEIAQPTIFAIQVALVELLASWGIRARAVVGHSVGEVAAAHVAGILTLGQAVRLVVHRGRLLEGAAGQGAMAAVDLDAETLSDRLTRHGGRIDVAARNAPESAVVSGNAEDLESFILTLAEEGIGAMRLDVGYAFHSYQMEAFCEPLAEQLSDLQIGAPSIPIYSTVTGAQAAPGDFSPRHWSRGIRAPVQFQAALKALADSGCDTFLEIGPHPALSRSIRDCLAAAGVQATILASWRRNQNELLTLLGSLATLHRNGAGLAWEALVPTGMPLSLPIYPWQRQYYWFGAQETQNTGGAQAWQQALDAADRQSRSGPFDLAVHSYAVKWTRLGQLSRAYMARALRRVGAFSKADEPQDLPSLIGQCGILPDFEALLARWLNTLAANGLIHRAGTSYFGLKRDADAQLARILTQSRRELADTPFLLEYICRCGDLLPEVLTGRVSPLETLFPNASFDTTEQLYHRWPVARYFNDIATAALSAWTSARPVGARLRILEIGAGTGGMTRALLPTLPADRTDYIFSDVSKFFFTRMRERLRDYPFVSFRLLDIEQDPITQGFEPQGYDVVVAANVLHATADLEVALAHVRKLLSHDGLLLIYEVTSQLAWLDISVGLIEGWHRFADDLRDEGPLLGADDWRALLERSGFDSPRSFPSPDSQAAVLGQHLIAARCSALGERGAAVTGDAEAASSCRSDWLYTLTWDPAPPPSDALGIAGTGAWLIFADRKGVGEALARQLDHRKGSPVLVFAGSDFSREAHDRFRIRPDSATDLQALIGSLEPERITGAVHLWSLDGPTAGQPLGTDPAPDGLIAPVSATSLLQRLSSLKGDDPPRIWFVTSGAQQAVTTHGPEFPFQASLWGLARVVQNELPSVFGGIVDLDPDETMYASAEHLRCEIAAHSREQVAYRDGARHLLRLQRLSKALPSSGLPLRPDAAYLITGGLGVLGQRVAERLVQRGARHLVLLSRSGLPARDRWDARGLGTDTVRRVAAVRALEAQGASVLCVAGDVADPATISQLIQTAKRQAGGDIRGVIHAAGKLGGQPLADVRRHTLDEAHSAKTTGAWLLHQCFRGMDLDFFILFGSASSILGPPGHGAYAAANACLDAFAQFRHTQGLPAVTISWGVWEDAGATARSVVDSLQSQGLEQIDFHSGLDLMERIAAGDDPHVVVLPGTPEEWLRHTPQLATLPLFEKLAAAANPLPRRTAWRYSESSDTPDTLDDGSRMEDLIRAAAAAVLKADPAGLPLDQSLLDLGLDSLMAVDLKHHIETRLGVSMPVTKFLEGLSIREVCAHIGEQSDQGHSAAVVTLTANEREILEI